MTTASPVTIVGATGLTGSASLKQLLASKTAFDITTIARKAINTPTAANPSTQYSHVLVEDLFEVPKSDQIIAKAGSTYVSALGTTRGSAGSFEAQEKIDVTLNVDMAKRAKEQGAERVSPRYASQIARGSFVLTVAVTLGHGSENWRTEKEN